MVYSILNLIVDIVASTLGFLFWLRFWCQAVRVRPPSPFGDFIARLTNWLVLPLRRFIPGAGGYDWASLVGAFLVALLAALVLSAVANRLMPATVLLLAVHQLASWILYSLMGALIIEVIFSWVNPNAPLAPFVRALNAPVMRPFRRILPPISGVDLSPILAFIVLRIALAIVDSVFRVA